MGSLSGNTCYAVNLCFLQDAFDDAVKYFGENPKTTPPSVFFPVFVRFVKAYKVNRASSSSVPPNPIWYLHGSRFPTNHLMAPSSFDAV